MEASYNSKYRSRTTLEWFIIAALSRLAHLQERAGWEPSYTIRSREDLSTNSPAVKSPAESISQRVQTRMARLGGWLAS